MYKGKRGKCVLSFMSRKFLSHPKINKAKKKMSHVCVMFTEELRQMFQVQIRQTHDVMCWGSSQATKSHFP